MGGNFLVAAFVPAMGFVILAQFIFQPILPPGIIERIGGDFSDLDFAKLGAYTLLVFLLTTILGFTLFTLSTFTYKSFEGYTFILGADTRLRRSLLRRQKRRAKKILAKKVIVEREVRKLEDILFVKNIKKGDQNGWQVRRTH